MILILIDRWGLWAILVESGHHAPELALSCSIAQLQGGPKLVAQFRSPPSTKLAEHFVLCTKQPPKLAGHFVQVKY